MAIVVIYGIVAATHICVCFRIMSVRAHAAANPFAVAIIVGRVRATVVSA